MVRFPWRRTWHGRALTISFRGISTDFGRMGFPSASIFALWVTCLADCAITRGPFTGAFLLYLSCLTLGIGLLHGFGWEVLYATIRRLPRTLRAPVWLALCAALGGWIASLLGAFVRLGSRYHQLAVAVLGACSCGALGVAVMAIGFQPTVRSPFGRFRRLTAVNRWLLVLSLLATTVVLTAIDRRFYIGYYFEAHVALRICAFWLLMFAVLVTLKYRELFAWNRTRFLAASGCFLVPVLLLRESDADIFYAFGVRPYPSLVLNISRRLFDFDGDGYSSLLGDGDCAPFNPAIHPGAREIPGNGVDDNCIAGDGAVTTPSSNPDEVPIPREPSPLNVILITADALRPDHLGLYEPTYGPLGRATTPELDRWSADAVVYRRAYTAGAWTGIAIGSLMRGLYPRRLHWTTYYEGNQIPLRLLRKPFDSQLRPGEVIASAFLFAANDRHLPLAWWLRRRGMWTIAVVDDGFTEVLSPAVGTDKGFSSYRNVKREKGLRDDDSGTAELAIRTLNTMRRGNPFFLWVHFFGTHGPSATHVGIREYGDTVLDRYDHEVRFLDEQLGRLLRAIDAHSARANTAIFISSDHGETIYGNGRRHGFELNESDIRVPLIAKVPGWKPQSREEPVSLVDVMPTILALTKTPAPPRLDGIDLGQRLGTTGVVGERLLISDTWRLKRTGVIALDITSVYDGREKLTFNRLPGTLYLHDQRSLYEPRRLIYSRSQNRLSKALWQYIETTGGPPIIDE